MNELSVKCFFIYFISLLFWSQLACKDWNFKSWVLPPAEEREARSWIAETRTSLCCRVKAITPNSGPLPHLSGAHQFASVTGEKIQLLTLLLVSVFKFPAEDSSLCVVLPPERYILVVLLGRTQAHPSVSLELPEPPQAEHPLHREGLAAKSSTGTVGPHLSPRASGIAYFLSTGWVPWFKILF